MQILSPKLISLLAGSVLMFLSSQGYCGREGELDRSYWLTKSPSFRGEVETAEESHKSVKAMLEDIKEGDHLDEITILTLRHNKINDDEAKEIAGFVKGKLKGLNELDIAYNEISEDGVRLFARLLRKRNFNYLVLLGNKGGAEGGGSIEALRILEEELNKANYKHEDSNRKISPKTISKYLSKVIFLPESYLTNSHYSRKIPEDRRKAHATYWKQRESGNSSDNHH